MERKKEKKVKRLSFILILVLMLVFLTACAKEKNPDIPEGMTVSENEAVDYFLYYPEEWKINRNDGMVSVYASDNDRSNVSVTGFTAPADVSNVEDYLNNDYLGYVESNFPELEMLTSGEVSTLGGVDSRKYVFTANIAGGDYKFMQNITYRYGYIYIFTYTSSADMFDTHIDNVNKMAEAFEFKN